MLSNPDTKQGNRRIVVIAERCKDCGYCIEFCPRHILYKSTVTNSRGYHIVAVDDIDKCTGCNLCRMVCPDFAIEAVTVGENSGKDV